MGERDHQLAPPVFPAAPAEASREIAAENSQRVIELAAERFRAAAREAVQQRERSEGVGGTRAGQQRPSHGPEIALTAASEPEQDITRSTERAIGGIFGGFARMAERVLGGLFSLFAGDEPKQTVQQVRDRQQAEGNIETQHARAHEAEMQEHDARLQRTLDEIRRTENDRQAAPEYFRPIIRPINRERDRDEGYERERERER